MVTFKKLSTTKTYTHSHADISEAYFSKDIDGIDMAKDKCVF